MTGGPKSIARQASNSPAPLPAGTPAPDFSLASGPDTELRLSDLRGHPVILVFYPADWSPVCGDQLALFKWHLDGQPQQAALFIPPHRQRPVLPGTPGVMHGVRRHIADLPAALLDILGRRAERVRK